METKFKVGDKVRAWGIDGVVKPSYMNSSELLVAFDNNKYQYFDQEGKAQSWHKEPTLILVERPKKKIKKTLEVWGCRYVNGGLASNDVYKTKLEVEDRIAGSAYVVPIHLTGTYEVEVDNNE